MQSSSHPWPPADEPVTPAAIVARLDDLGWTVGTYRLEAHTGLYVLVTYARATIILDLRDGREVARYAGPRAGHMAFSLYLRRAREGAEQ